MTSFFVGSDYQGVSFQTINDVLTLIRDSLTSENWTIELDDISANSVLKLKGQDINNNTDYCYYIFQADTNNDLEIKGYLGDTNDSGEESNSFIMEVSENTDNRLWLTANSGSAAIMILDGSVGFSVRSTPSEFKLNGLNALHFGFLERVSLNDKYAWMIGRIDYDYIDVQIARRFTGLNDAWLLIGDDYEYADSYDERYQRIPITTFDPIMLAKSRYYYVGDNNINNVPLRSAPKGSFNGVDGLPYFGTFYYIEGRKDSSDNDDYGDTLTTKPLIYRGNVRFCATGLASALALNLFADSFGQIWISTNNYGAQAMRVG